MIQKDYVLRLIEEFGIALRKIIQLRKSNQPKEAHLLIEQCYSGFLKLDISLISQMSGDQFISWVNQQTLQTLQLRVLADLLNEEGEIFLLIRDQSTALDRFVKALLLLQYINNLDPHTYSFGRMKKMATLEQKINTIKNHLLSNTD